MTLFVHRGDQTIGDSTVAESLSDNPVSILAGHSKIGLTVLFSPDGRPLPSTDEDMSKKISTVGRGRGSKQASLGTLNRGFGIRICGGGGGGMFGLIVSTWLPGRKENCYDFGGQATASA